MRSGLRIRLTAARLRRYRRCMAHAYVVSDFGANEEAAQAARHKVEGWKQGFRLGNKILLKFDRGEGGEKHETEAETGSSKSGKKKHEKKETAAEKVIVLVRLDFSDHEKLSLHRWLERIPSEQAFKPAKSRVVRHGDAEFEKIESQFDSLD
jgi:hypothetical protein